MKREQVVHDAGTAHSVVARIKGMKRSPAVYASFNAAEYWVQCQLGKDSEWTGSETIQRYETNWLDRSIVEAVQIHDVVGLIVQTSDVMT